MKRAKYNLLAILILAVFTIVLVLGNVFYARISVATVSGSYAEEFAKKYHLKMVEVPDNFKGDLDLRYETFEYNIPSTGIVLERYNCISKELVIPEVYEGTNVIGLSDDFFKVCEAEKLYIPPTVSTFPAEAAKNVTLVVPDDSTVREELIEKGWNVETYADSEAPNFFLSEIPFGYNDLGDSIELTMYTGDEDILVVPSHINGKPVTSIAFDMFGRVSLVIIPSTVTNISGTVGVIFSTKTFVIEIIFTLIAFVLSMLVLNLKMPKLSEANEYHLTGPQVVLSFVYLIAQSVFAILAIYKLNLSPYASLAISAAMMVAYLLGVAMGGTGRKLAIKVVEKEEASVVWMDKMRADTAHLADGITDRETKKAVERVTEEIRYSNPRSYASLKNEEKNIEDEINHLKVLIDIQDYEGVKRTCSELTAALKQRDSAIKNIQ